MYLNRFTLKIKAKEKSIGEIVNSSERKIAEASADIVNLKTDLEKKDCEILIMKKPLNKAIQLKILKLLILKP